MGRPYDWHGRILPAGMDPNSVIGTLSTGYLDNAKLDFMRACPAGMVLASHPSIHGDRPRMRAISTLVPPSTPAGSTTQIQFNNAGAFGGSADLTLDTSSDPTLTLGASAAGVFQTRNGSEILIFNADDGFRGRIKIDISNQLTADREWRWPNASGTLAIPAGSITGSVQFLSASGELEADNNLTFTASGLYIERDITVGDSSKGLVLTSPDSSTHRATVNNAGVISTPTSSTSLVRVMSADQTISLDATLGNLTDLVFPIAANETWVYQFVLSVGDAVGNTGFQFDLAIPSGATVKYWYTIENDSDLSQEYPPFTGSTVANGTPLAFADGWSYGAVNVYVRALVVNGANAGNVQAQFAQFGSNASDLTFKAGSFGVGNKA